MSPPRIGLKYEESISRNGKSMSDLPFKEKLASINFGLSKRREPKRVNDELGNVTTHHWDDRVDVKINAPALVRTTSTEEVRNAS